MWTYLDCQESAGAQFETAVVVVIVVGGKGDGDHGVFDGVSRSELVVWIGA